MTHALLIDGENLSATHAATILGAVPADAVVRRVYGDVARLNGWMAVPGLRAVHMVQGRNSADILLAIDATHIAGKGEVLAGKGEVAHFRIAAFDRGLVHLVHHLRETGKTVILVVEDKAPPHCGLRRIASSACPPRRKSRLAGPGPGPSLCSLSATRSATPTPKVC